MRHRIGKSKSSGGETEYLCLGLNLVGERLNLENSLCEKRRVEGVRLRLAWTGVRNGKLWFRENGMGGER